MNGHGVHHFWGFSPPLDAQEVYTRAISKYCEQFKRPDGLDADTREPLRILLLMPSDPRSVLKTIAQRLRHSNRPLHIYVMDRPTEVLARHALLVQVALDWELPIRQRSSVYLEIFGNCLLQERTSKYVSQKRLELIELLGNGTGPLAGLIDFSALKYKHRDELEVVFKSWDHRVPFDMHTLRDYRLRHHFGERYDYRNNLIDWDYQASVKPSAGNVHYVLYKGWRNTGVAFEFGDQTYTVPNRTLASYAEGKERGRGTTLRRGFWTDVVVSPYHALGTSLSVHGPLTPHLFDVHNRNTGSEQFRHTAVEVAVVNVVSFMYEIEMARPYSLTEAHEIYSGLGVEAAPAPVPPVADAAALPPIAEEEEEEAAVPPPVPAAAPPPPPTVSAAAPPPPTVDEAEAIAHNVVRALHDVKIFPMIGDVTDLLKKTQWAHKFDYVEFSSHAVHHLLNPAVVEIFADTAVVVAETGRNIVDLKDTQKALFEQKVLKMCGDLGAVYVGSETVLSSDRRAVGSLVLSSRHKERVGKSAARARAANVVVDGRAAALFPSATTASVVAVKNLKRANACASEDTEGGDNPRPQYFGAVWTRATSAANAEAFKRLWAEAPAIEMGAGTSEGAASEGATETK